MTPADCAPKDDAELVALCRRGRSAAFDVLVERHRRSVYSSATASPAITRTQATSPRTRFFAPTGRSGTFKGHSAFGTWLYRVAVNVCPEPQGGQAPGPPNPSTSASSPIGAPTRPIGSCSASKPLRFVRAAIARLPDKQRATMILRTYQELPHEEIASILGSSVGAVKANFFHALANLKKLLRESDR
jgi:RNA polymerase sigma-70 factor (ECF subfamily)